MEVDNRVQKNEIADRRLQSGKTQVSELRSYPLEKEIEKARSSWKEEEEKKRNKEKVRRRIQLGRGRWHVVNCLCGTCACQLIVNCNCCQCCDHRRN